ncbi:MAG: signal peptidase I [Spirochaetaceae bacterium]
MIGSSRWERYSDYKHARRKGHPVLRVLLLLFYVFIAVQVIWALFFQSYRITSVAMAPTLQPGDRVLVNRLPDGPLGGLLGGTRRLPDRGDLVLAVPAYAPADGSLSRIFDGVLRFLTFQSFSGFRATDPTDTRLVFRRVLALPGDEIRMDDYVFRVREGADGAFRNEFETTGLNYELERRPPPSGWRREDPFSGTMVPLSLSEGELFISGDNRGAALDSRHWGGISLEDIEGRVFFRLWPLSRFGRL